MVEIPKALDRCSLLLHRRANIIITVDPSALTQSTDVNRHPNRATSPPAHKLPTLALEQLKNRNPRTSKNRAWKWRETLDYHLAIPQNLKKF
jgi:hypothetical protein